MARKPATRAEFVLFDVFYEDGSRRSNRRVPSEILGGLDGDAPARSVIEEQDRLIAERSGNPVLESFPFVSNREGIPKELSMRESDGIDSLWGEQCRSRTRWTCVNG